MNLTEQLDTLRIAKDLRTPIERLMRALDEASYPAEVAEEVKIQIAFVEDMVGAKKIYGTQVEKLHILFDNAVQARLEEIAA